MVKLIKKLISVPDAAPEFVQCDPISPNRHGVKLLSDFKRHSFIITMSKTYILAFDDNSQIIYYVFS